MHRKNIFVQKYKNYFIVCAPSYKGDDKKRGFNHIKEVAKCLGLEIIDCLKKESNYKQSEKKLCKRNEIQKYIMLKQIIHL